MRKTVRDWFWARSQSFRDSGQSDPGHRWDRPELANRGSAVARCAAQRQNSAGRLRPGYSRLSRRWELTSRRSGRPFGRVRARRRAICAVCGRRVRHLLLQLDHRASRRFPVSAAVCRRSAPSRARHMATNTGSRVPLRAALAYSCLSLAPAKLATKARPQLHHLRVDTSSFPRGRRRAGR